MNNHFNSASSQTRHAYPQRELDWRGLATLMISSIAFMGIWEGVNSLLPDHQWFAFGIAAAITLISIMSIRRFKDALAIGVWRVAAANLLLWAIVAAVTASLGYGAFFKWLASDAAAQAVHERALKSLDDALGELDANYGALLRSLEATAKLSEEAYRLEDKKGSSCAFASDKGQGTIWRFRELDARAFKAKHEEVATDVKAIQTQIAEIKHARLNTAQVQEQRRHFAAIERFINQRGIENPLLSPLAAFLDERAGAGASIPGRGKACDDPQRDAQITAARSIVALIQETRPVEAPALFDPLDTRNQTRRAMGFIAKAIWLLLSGNFPAIAQIETISGLPREEEGLDAAVPLDVFPLAFTLLVEMLLLALTHGTIADAEKRDGARSWRHTVWLYLTVPVAEQSRMIMHRIAARFAPHLASVDALRLRSLPHLRMIAVPNRPGFEQEAAAVASLEDMGHAALISGAFDRSRLPPQLHAAVQGALGHGSHDEDISLYRLSRTFEKWLNWRGARAASA